MAATLHAVYESERSDWFRRSGALGEACWEDAKSSGLQTAATYSAFQAAFTT